MSVNPAASRRTMATATGRETRSATSRKRANDGDQASPKKPRIEGKTDHSRWRLKDDDSRHTWHYLTEDKAVKDWPQSYAEKYFLNLPLVRCGLLHGSAIVLTITTGAPRPPQTKNSDRLCPKWSRLL